MNQYEGHRKKVKLIHEPGDFHEFTFSCFHRRPLLTNNEWREELSRAIDTANAELSFELVAFVYMPEHVHLLVFPTQSEPDLGFYLSRIKQPFSKYVHSRLLAVNSKLVESLTVQERPGKNCFRFWQEGPGYDRNLHSMFAIQNSIDYIHLNPVKRELCSKAIDWRWSSARYYLADPVQQQFPELPTLHGLRPEVFDQDEYR